MRPQELFDLAVRTAPPGSGGFRTASEVLDRAELLQRVSEVAAWLAAVAPPRSRVAVAAREPAWRTVLCLAVAAADLTMVPLEPDWLRARVDQAVRDAGVAVVVLDPAGSAAADWEPTAPPTPGPGGLAAAVQPDAARDADELYVMFTSGSTGRPKAVRMLPDAALAHARAAVDWLQLTPRDVVLQFTRLSFDASQEELWPAFLAGATIAAATDVVPTFNAFARDLSTHSVSVLDLPTAYWRAWATAIRTKDLELPCPRLVCIGGEPAYWRDADTWRRGPLGSVRLVNSYGPTEAGITATSYEVPAVLGEVPLGVGLPIGRPLGARSVHLEPYDAERSELWLTGDALAAGYLSPPASDPFTRLDGRPCYRTRDLVTVDPEGNLVYAGRLDREVKVRGHRVRLDDVETALMTLDEVEETLVVLVESAGDRFLVAAVAPEGAPNPAGLRERLGVDAAAVPRHVLGLPALPRNAAGKVDLPEVERLLAAQHADWTPAR